MLYALIARLLLPAAWWGWLRVEGIELVPSAGPLLLVPNHDSQMDPVIVGVALRKRRRLRFLARANLWQIPGLGPILHRMGQIPIKRGAGDADALAKAVEALADGAAICVFPEGKLSLGERLRARTGVARLAAACPEAEIVLCAIEGTTDFVRFPKRPRVRVTFFPPGDGLPPAADDGTAFATRLLDQVRGRVPPATAGRRAPRDKLVPAG